MDIRPPEGFTTTRPPYVISPLRTISWALPGGQRDSASRVINSFVEKQSWSSTSLIALGATFASERACSAADLVIAKPIRSIALLEYRSGESLFRLTSRYTPGYRRHIGGKCT